MLESLHSARRLSCYTVRHGQAIALHANARGTVLRYTATLMHCAARQRFWGSMQHAKAVYEKAQFLPDAALCCTAWCGDAV